MNASTAACRQADPAGMRSITAEREYYEQWVLEGESPTWTAAARRGRDIWAAYTGIMRHLHPLDLATLGTFALLVYLISEQQGTSPEEVSQEQLKDALNAWELHATDTKAVADWLMCGLLELGHADDLCSDDPASRVWGFLTYSFNGEPLGNGAPWHGTLLRHGISRIAGTFAQIPRRSV